MKLVIDIPDYTYEELRDCKGVITIGEAIAITQAIKNGTPLPKGHGDLIDKSELMKAYAPFEFTGDMGDAMEILDNFDAIIEADGGGEDEVSN